VYPKIMMLRPDLIIDAPYLRQSILGEGKLRAPARGVLVAYETEGRTRHAWWLHRHDRVFRPDGPFATRVPAEAVCPSTIPGLLDAAHTTLAVERARAREECS